MVKRSLGIFYSYLYTKMYQRFVVENNLCVVDKKELRLFLRHFRIPHDLRPQVIRELSQIGYLDVGNGTRGTVRFRRIVDESFYH